MRRWLAEGLCLLITPVWACAAGAESAPPAAISSVVGDAGHTYTWTVTNQSDSPILYVAIPQYHGSLFFAPDGWDTSDSTYLVGVGVEDRPGRCVAKVTEGAAGILPGGHAVFRLQLTAGLARRGTGDAVVRFADGATATIPGVEIPQPESAGDKYITLIGLGLIFLVWLGARSVWKRRSGAGVPSGSPD